MKMLSKKTIIPAFMIVIIIIVIASMRPRDEGKIDSEEAGEVPVRVQEVTLQTLDLMTQATGTISSKYEIPLMPEISGTVIKKAKNIGDAVKSGEAIILLDAEPYELALMQASAAYRSAQAAHRQAKRDTERATELYQSEDISMYEMEAANLAQETAEANLTAAEAAMKMAERNLRLTKLSSPVDGYAADLNARIGQQVTPGTPLGLIVSLEELEIEIGLSEREIVDVKPGNRVIINSSVFPDMDFSGRVKSVGVAGLELAKSFPVVVAVDNSTGHLRPGMIVNLDIFWERKDDVILIPRRSLLLDTEIPTVFVVLNNRSFSQHVVLGKGDGLRVIAKSGLEPGDSLVVEGQNALKDSVRVKAL